MHYRIRLKDAEAAQIVTMVRRWQCSIITLTISLLYLALFVLMVHILQPRSLSLSTDLTFPFLCAVT